jgi:hypothetical protein
MERNVALRIRGKGSVFQNVPAPERFSADLREWKTAQETFKDRRVLVPVGSSSQPRNVFAGIRARHSPTDVRLAAADGLQSTQGRGDHSARTAAQRGHDAPQPRGKGFEVTDHERKFQRKPGQTAPLSCVSFP